MNQLDVKAELAAAKKLRGKRYVKDGFPFELVNVYLRQTPPDDFFVYGLLKEEKQDGDQWEIRIDSINDLFQPLG